MPTDLRRATIRLAAANDDLRAHLLPLLRVADAKPPCTVTISSRLEKIQRQRGKVRVVTLGVSIPHAKTYDPVVVGAVDRAVRSIYKKAVDAISAAGAHVEGRPTVSSMHDNIFESVLRISAVVADDGAALVDALTALVGVLTPHLDMKMNIDT